MILGIKVGPQRQSFFDLQQTNAPFAEVWFDINRASEYQELFDEMKRRHMQVGLHFWGVLDDDIMVSFGYPDQSVLNNSKKLVKKTIDIAAKNGFQYVNIHPGSRAIVKMDLEQMDYPYVSDPLPLAQAQPLFIDQITELNSYARNRNIILTVETVSRLLQKTDWYNPKSRLSPFQIYQFPVSTIQKIGSLGIAVANDFVHTATDPISDKADIIWNYLYNTTKTLASATKLIHLGFLIPPFNGTDNHDSLDNPVLETNQALPNRQQMIELLKLFKDRNDVFILTEPNGRHTENYLIAMKILNQAIS